MNHAIVVLHSDCDATRPSDLKQLASMIRERLADPHVPIYVSDLRENSNETVGFDVEWEMPEEVR